MLYILSGPDDFSLNDSLARIKKSLGDESLLATNTTILDGQRLTPQQLAAVTETVPFLAPKRLVIVTRLLERFQSKARPGRKKETAAGPPDGHESFGRCLKQLPASTVLVLIDGQVARGNPLFKEISAVAEVKAFPLFRGEKLNSWIMGRVGKEGGSISPRAADLLARLVGSNLWIMAGEITKLVLYTSGRLIEEDGVRTVVGYAQQANVFAMVDAILEFKVSLALKSLERLLVAGVAPSYLLFMLVRQVRLIVRAKGLKRQGKGERQIQQTLGLASDFALGKTLKQAAGYSFRRLREIYEKLLETDLAIKTGRRDGELALNILAAELCYRG